MQTKVASAQGGCTAARVFLVLIGPAELVGQGWFEEGLDAGWRSYRSTQGSPRHRAWG